MCATVRVRLSAMRPITHGTLSRWHAIRKSVTVFGRIAAFALLCKVDEMYTVSTKSEPLKIFWITYMKFGDSDPNKSGCMHYLILFNTELAHTCQCKTYRELSFFWTRCICIIRSISRWTHGYTSLTISIGLYCSRRNQLSLIASGAAREGKATGSMAGQSMKKEVCT